jgi:CRP/FNR family transcriptional regulator, cyclic AMP receptor protein
MKRLPLTGNCSPHVNKVTKTGDCNHCAPTAHGCITSSMESMSQSSCLSCDFRPDRLFCDMPPESLKAFDEIKMLASYPRSALLFAEGKPVRGIYILCDGRAKLSIRGENGKRLTLRIANPGEVLGLGAALSNTPYEVTAELLDMSQVVFVRRKELVKFLHDNPTICLQVVRMLSQDLHGAYERVRSIALLRARRPHVPLRPRAAARAMVV